MPAPTDRASDRLDPRGIAAGFAGYAWFGLLPLYFPLLAPAGPLEITAHRVVWSVVACLALLAILGRLGAFTSLLRQPRLTARLALAATLLCANWTVYVFAVITGHVVDGALGYYINPLVTVVLAVLVLGERLRRAQWVAVGFAAAGVLVIAIGFGSFPWIAIVLALSFGGYGLMKKQVGARVEALPGLAVETLVLTPVALAFLVVLAVRGEGTFGSPGSGAMPAAGLAALLIAAGIVTSVPLVLFATASRRLPLAMMGLLQYVTPTMQFLTGVLIYREAMDSSRWAGFALVWVALVLLTWDMFRAGRRMPRLAPPDQ
ncbi:EamA family transporter RarD [Ruania halotolerans]|uniref:EamA family transporter RarD n=1 Tax=Ruania halotolerans TaxID=2897773 RepID=UPI001E436758|nr:EamA family transporter RarD [Ruania halotolerans]UFU05793.1 EamA family transporter RarD [Ruania halotolerans]